MTGRRTRRIVAESESRGTRISDELQLSDSNENTQTLQKDSEQSLRSSRDDSISSTSVNSLKLRYAELLAEKEKALLQQKIADLEIEKIMGWQPDPATSQQTIAEAEERVLLAREKAAAERERLIKVAMPSRYKGLNKREYDTFVRTCDNVFDTQPTIYQLELSKTQFVQSLLDGDPASQQ